MADVAPSVLDGALLGLPHPVFDLGEGLLDRVEIWGVRRQIPQPGSRGADHLADGSGLVRAQIIHDDDITRFEGGHELLFDIGPEALAVDRSVKDARSSEPIKPQSAEES